MLSSIRFAFLLILSILIFSVFPVYADSGWQKYPTNPIITATNFWENPNVLNPYIMKENNIYKLFYTGGPPWKIGYATSNNGIQNWIKTLNPILQATGSWEKDIGFLAIKKENNTYKSWYQTNGSIWQEGPDRFRLGYATGNNELSLVKYPSYVLKGTTNYWDSGGTDRGLSVIYKDGIYHLWYAGTNSDSLGTNPFWRIGYAKSIDGINWVKQNSGNPVIEPTESWELKNVAYPNVIYENGLFKMWYAASSWDMPTQIVYATSTDGINWDKPDDQNPALTTSTSGFDRVGISSPSVLHDGDMYRMWYSGFDGSKWRIGYATASAEVDMDVPLIKQTSDPWQSETYDFAKLWSGSEPDTIYRWGCAMTSAVMVLQYYGFNKIDENTNLDPGNLNKWLINQPDGYIPNGQTNWLAIARLSKLAAPVNNITAFDALEYDNNGGSDLNKVKESINNNIPTILNVPGHFIVAKGINGDTVNINDPFYSKTTLRDGYSNSFIAQGKYTPSNTDLSYIMLVTDQNTILTVFDSSNQIVGQEFLQQPIIDPVSGNKSNKDPIKMYYFQKPATSNYKIVVSANNYKTYNLNIYLYDIDGNVNKLNQNGIIGQNTSENISINFDKQNSVNSRAEKIITFQVLLDDIQEANKLYYINPAVLGNLNAIIKNAKSDYEKGNKKIALLRLGTAETLLNSVRGKGIDEKAYQILMYDIKYLKTHL